MISLETAISGIKPLDQNAMQQAQERQNHLIKPLGSLGRLEEISVRMAGITGKVKNTVDKRVLFIYGADNGVYEEGVATSPQEFTNSLLTNYATDTNSAINVVCRHHNVDIKAIDIGVIGDMDYSVIDNRCLMQSTKNFAKEPAMSREIAKKAVEVGISYAKYAKENGYEIIGTGEIGMANTTTAAACTMAALSLTDADLAVGRGAGLTDDALKLKKEVITKALELHKPDPEDALDILSKVGGLDIAGMAGTFIGAAYYRIPVVIDGVISISAALLASILAPGAKDYMFCSHLSQEPSYQLVAQRMGVTPYLNLEMRLGEGAGCPLGMALIENALVFMNVMDTYQDLELPTDYRVDFEEE